MANDDMKLINKDSAIKAIEGLQDCYNGFSDTYDKACIIGVIDELPVVNAVEIVQCKDCIHACGYTTGNGLYGGMVCECIDRDVDENFYCAYGERKQNEIDLC